MFDIHLNYIYRIPNKSSSYFFTFHFFDPFLLKMQPIHHIDIIFANILRNIRALAATFQH